MSFNLFVQPLVAPSHGEATVSLGLVSALKEAQ